MRFIGVDGPRWFLRGVISGQGAVQPEAAGLLEQVFRDTVVVRGEGPMAPRDPIVLKLPDDAQMMPEGVQQEEQEGSRFSGGMGHVAARPRDHRGALTAGCRGDKRQRLTENSRRRWVALLNGVRPTCVSPGHEPYPYVVRKAVPADRKGRRQRERIGRIRGFPYEVRIFRSHLS